MNRWERRDPKFLNIYCPPLLYLNCNFHSSLRHPLGATLAEDKRSRKAEVEAPGLAADCPKSELHLSVIHSLDISIFPISDMNCEDTQKCMTVKKTILCLLCCWAFWCPQRTGSSVDVTSAWLLWITLGSQRRIPRDSNETLFLPAPQSAPSIADQLRASS